MKRVCDILLVLLAAPLWLPVLALTALAVLIAEGRPVFFTQTRAGLRGRPFRIVKFRSMRTGAGSDAERLGRFGRFLRRGGPAKRQRVFQGHLDASPHRQDHRG